GGCDGRPRRRRAPRSRGLPVEPEQAAIRALIDARVGEVVEGPLRHPDDAVPDEPRALTGAVFGMLETTLPLEYRPAGVAVLGELREDAAEIALAVCRGIFAKLAQYGYAGWAVLEWECCLKHPEDGAREGARFIRDRIIRVTERAFDDFADSGVDQGANRRLLGLDGKAS